MKIRSISRFVLAGVLLVSFNASAVPGLWQQGFGQGNAEYSVWIGPYISIHFLSLNPLLVRRRRYSRGERYPSALCGCHSL